MAAPIHRNSDSRSCGATTIVIGQSTVFVNGLLASVKGDPNSHSDGKLLATINDGTVFINNKKLVLKGSDAVPDKKIGVEHQDPKSVGASPNVFACGGPSGSSGGGGYVQDTTPDPTGKSLYLNSKETSLQNNTTNPAGADAYDPSAFSAADQARIAALQNDPAWASELASLHSRYPGLSDTELYQIINGESNFNTQARNPSGATGLFQLMPASARELGYTTTQISQMTAPQQLHVYGQYLDRWNYNTNNSLGIMQAAPAYAGRSGGSVIYPVGSRAWRQNPGWQSAGGGAITVDSINQFYRG